MNSQIMLSSQELRQHYSKDIKHRVFISNMTSDYWIIFNMYEQQLYSFIHKTLQKGNDMYIVADYMKIIQPRVYQQTNVKVSTFFNGFWDSKEKRFKKDVFEEMQVQPMLIALTEKFADFGYILTDISDPERSNREFLKILIE